MVATIVRENVTVVNPQHKELEYLRGLTLPQSAIDLKSNTYQPISHGQAFRKVEDALSRKGLEIDVDVNLPSPISLTMSGKTASQIFVSMRLRSTIANGIKFMVGMINSFDKTRSLQIAFGSVVMVCQNNHIYSNNALRLKHSPGNINDGSLDLAIDDTLDQFAFFQEQQGTFFNRLKEIEVTKRDAQSFILESLEDEIIVGQEWKAVKDQWDNPRFEEFAKDQSAYRLFNAFTDVHKRGIEVTNKDGVTEVNKQGIMQRNGGTFADRSQVLASRMDRYFDLGMQRPATWN